MEFPSRVMQLPVLTTFFQDTNKAKRPRISLELQKLGLS